ncbi:hypothetical protein LJB42_003364 [Komagataella kurtzmanii]|nr:hypothetical protein LJB42_003364 [Komagataella kurtzmanii]
MRKAVSFSEGLSSDSSKLSPSKKDGDDTKNEKNPNVTPLRVPPLNHPVTVLPFQSLYAAYALFAKYDVLKNKNEALVQSLKGLIGLQFAYGVLILFNYSQDSTQSRKRSYFGNFAVIILNIIISLIMSVPVHMLLLLFGAPILSLNKETFLLAAHLSLLTVFPILSTYRATHAEKDFGMTFSTLFFRLVTVQVHGDISKHIVYMTLLGTVFGTWLGITPIPLDWDRPWQEWPITLLVGAFLGNFVGGLISCISILFF